MQLDFPPGYLNISASKETKQKVVSPPCQERSNSQATGLWSHMTAIVGQDEMEKETCGKGAIRCFLRRIDLLLVCFTLMHHDLICIQRGFFMNAFD